MRRAATSRTWVGQVLGLDRVDRQHRRLELGRHVEHPRRVGLGEQVEVLRVDAQPVGPQLHLPCGLLARHVEHRTPGELLGEPIERGDEQRALADARIAAEEHQHPGNHPAAQHPVELADAGSDPLVLARHHLGEPDRLGRAAGRRCAGRTPDVRRDLLVEGVPAVAGGALPHPLGRGMAAFRAGVEGLQSRDGAGHG
jgi:hypothetical protein